MCSAGVDARISSEERAQKEGNDGAGGYSTSTEDRNAKAVKVCIAGMICGITAQILHSGDSLHGGLPH